MRTVYEGVWNWVHGCLRISTCKIYDHDVGKSIKRYVHTDFHCKHRRQKKKDIGTLVRILIIPRLPLIVWYGRLLCSLRH